jgi:hypothetical protein
MIKDPDFKLKDAKLKDGRVSINLSFDDKVGKRTGNIVHANIDFDPQMKWAVRDYQLTDGDKFSISRKAEFADQRIDHYCPPVQIVSEYRRPHNSSFVYLTRTARFESVKKSAASPEVFRLRAYNLPEPPELETQVSNRFRIFTYLAIVFGGFTVLFWWLKKRNKGMPLGRT